MCELPTWVEGSDGQLNCMRRTTGGLEQDQAHLRGQSRLLHETLSSSGILASAFDDPYWTGLALHDLAWVLSDRDRTIRNQAAAYVMEGLWHHQKRIGIRKLIRRVAESQFRQVSWDGYRDHISHTVIVFLNGLYIYSTLPAVQIAFSNTLGWDESAFLQHWSLTATAHDIGYIFELTDENDRASSFSFVTDLSNNFLSYIEEELEPILVQDGHQARSLRDDENRRSQILSVLGLNQRKIQDVEDLETVWGSNLSLLAFLDERCADTKLHPEHPISNYYNQCLRTSPSLKGNRPPFRDHGVCGALLLLHFAHLQKTFFECLDRVLCDTTSQGFEDLRAIGRVEVLQSLCQWAGSQEGIVDSASEAAVAIALHNVQNVWNSSPATARLDLSAYSIHLDKYPLAFLLYVSDVLQDWDRAVYSPSGEVEREWRDAWDVRFATASEDRENTHLFIWAGRRTRIDNIRQNLKDVLPEPDRNRLLREGPPPTEQHHSEDEHTLETSDGLQTLSPIDDYIEREQLFASYSDFLASDDTWVFSVVGDPGTGKSRFLDRRYGEAQEDGTITVRIDFCRGYESPDLFAEELISQLPLNSNIERRARALIASYRERERELLASGPRLTEFERTQQLAIPAVLDMPVQGGNIQTGQFLGPGLGSDQTLSSLDAGPGTPQSLIGTYREIHRERYTVPLRRDGVNLEMARLANDLAVLLGSAVLDDTIIFLDTTEVLKRVRPLRGGVVSTMAEPGMAEWLFLYLLISLHNKTPKLKVVTAGWVELRTQVPDAPRILKAQEARLGTFTEDVAKKYLEQYGIIENDLVDALCSFTERYPEFMHYCVAAEPRLTTRDIANMQNSPANPGWHQNMTTYLDRVEARLRRVDPILETCVVYGVLARIFDPTILSALIARQIPDNTWTALTGLPFVEPAETGFWKFRDLFRRCRYPRIFADAGNRLMDFRARLGAALAARVEETPVGGDDECLNAVRKDLALDAMSELLACKAHEAEEFAARRIAEAAYHADDEWGMKLVEALRSGIPANVAIQRRTRDWEQMFQAIKRNDLGTAAADLNELLSIPDIQPVVAASVAYSLTVIACSLGDIAKAREYATYLTSHFPDDRRTPKAWLTIGLSTGDDSVANEAAEAQLRCAESSINDVNQLMLYYKRRGCWDEAIDVLDKAVEIEAETAASCWSMAWKILAKQKGDPHEAEAYLRSRIVQDEVTFPSAIVLADFLEHQGRWEETIECLCSLADRFPSEIATTVGRASRIIDTKLSDPQRCLQFLQDWKTSYPDHKDLLFPFAHYYYRHAEWNEYIEVVRKEVAAFPDRAGDFIADIAEIRFQKIGGATDVIDFIEEQPQEIGSNWKVLAVKAMCLERVGRWDEALNVHWQIAEVEQEQINAALSHIEAITLQALRQPEIAVQKYYRAIQLAEEPRNLRVMLYHLFEKLGRKGASEQVLRDIETHHARDAGEASVAAIEIRSNLEDHDAVLKEAKEIGAARPTDTKAMLAIAQLEDKLGMHRQAFNRFRALAFREGSDFSKCLKGAVQALIADGDVESAVREFEEYCEKWKGSIEIRIGLGMLLEKETNRFEDALRVFSDINETDEDIVSQKMDGIVGVLDIYIGDRQRSRCELDAFTERHPGNPKVWRLAGSILGIWGDWGDAASALQRASELDPDSIELRREQAECLVKAGLYDSCERTLKDTLTRWPEDIDTRGHLAMALEMMSRWPESLEEHERIGDLHWQVYPSSVHRRVRILAEEIDSRQEAFNLLDEALKRRPGNPLLLLCLAELHDFFGEQDQGLRLFADFMPTSPEEHLDQILLQARFFGLRLHNSEKALRLCEQAREIIQSHQSLQTASNWASLMIAVHRDADQPGTTVEWFNGLNHEFVKSPNVLHAVAKAYAAMRMNSEFESILGKLMQLWQLDSMRSISQVPRARLAWLNFVKAPLQASPDRHRGINVPTWDIDSLRVDLIDSIANYLSDTNNKSLWQPQICEVRRRLPYPRLQWEIISTVKEVVWFNNLTTDTTTFVNCVEETLS